MPHIALTISGQPDAALTRSVAAAIADLTVEVLGKPRELIALSLQYLDPAQWIIDGQPLSESGRNAFQLDISITDETNTKAEKARYLAQVYARMAELIGDLHPTSYIHIIDARAAAYGYGGLTQERRYQMAAR
ncbi:4-oxalocrotonate tautomerase family protein [Lysobacter sp. CCNWLW3]|uniref:tautomerase family protein n=1 Tax=unclassified Lysobacter TaxID=2635362 RepID=UPI002FD1D42F